MKPLNQNLMRRFKTLLSTIVLLLPLTCLNAEEVVIDSVKYTYVSQTKYSVTGYIKGITNAVIVDSINGIAVTEIGNNAFEDCTSLTSVTLPEVVTSINTRAFSGCSNLISINIPDNIKNIGNRAFFECHSLTSITIPDGVSIDTSDMFSGCSSLKSVTLPSGISRIEGKAFYDCSSLLSISIPDGVTYIGYWAFKNCSSLSSISIPDGVTKIEYDAFNNCSSLSSITIPESVSSIGNGAFNGCSSLTSISIPERITSLGGGIFKNCIGLTSITIPQNITAIPEAFLSGCSSLTTVMIPEGVKSIDNYAFENCSSLTSISIPESVKSIGVGTFAGCSNLQTISIPSGVTVLPTYAFRDCSSLSSINLPESLTSIEYWAFSGCSSLISIVIPNSVTSVSYDLFYYCTNLSSITIPSSLLINQSKSLGYGLDKLITVVVEGNTLLSTPFSNDNVIYVVEPDKLESYTTSSIWSLHQKKVYTKDMLMLKTVDVIADPMQSSLYEQLGDSSIYVANLKIVGSINGYDIMTLRNKTIRLLDLDLSEANIIANDEGYEYYPSCRLLEDNVLGDKSFLETNIRSVILPNSLKRVGNNAFDGCGYLERVVFNEGLESIGTSAFRKSGLTSIELPNSLIYLGYPDGGAFDDCEHLGSVIRIPDKVTEIPQWCFNRCYKIDTVYVGKNVSYIGYRAFNNSGITTLVLNNNIKEIHDIAFENCLNLKTVIFNRKLQSIGEGAFKDCSQLQEISLPYSVENIKNDAFKGCKSLKTIKIPSMARSLGRNAFGGCDSITSIYAYTVEPIDIDQNTFNCYLQATLYVPKTSARLYKYNTQWSQFVRVREFEEQYDAFYLNGDFELTERDGRLIGEPDAEMNSSSGFIVKGDDIQELNEIELVHDGKDCATIIGAADDLTGNQVNLTAQSMKANISVDGNRWYFFCFPFNVEHDSIECTTDYVFYSYNGGKRASEGSGWTKLESDFSLLEKGMGYIFQTSRTGILTIHVNSEYLSFTANNEKDQLHTYYSDDASNASWNFIGNPFICYYDVEDLANEYDAPIVVWNGNGYTAYKPGDDDYQLKPFEAFFVQKESGTSYVEFLPENRMTGNQAATRSSLRVRRRAEMGTPITLDRQLVNIVLMAQDSISDRTRIVYSTKASMDYEIGVDAAKFQADGVPQLYTLNGKTKYAINERPMGTDEIKLGYTAPKAGTYTLSVPRHDAEVEIYDNVAKSKVDFTFGDYSFHSQAGTLNDRFVIYKTGDGATRVENGFRLDGLTITSFDGGIDIEGKIAGKVQVYSDSGMLLAEPKQAGRVDLGDGVYIIKVGDKSVKMCVE